MTVNSDESPYELSDQIVSTENINVANTWSNTIERVLDKLRINCCQLSNFHKYKYQHAKSQIKWFRIPIIILSGINTFTSVGLHEFVKQSNVSIISSGISLICGIITGIEMFMKYQDKMEIELSTHKEYYRISIDIYKMISIDRSQRKITGKDFLDEKFNEYEKIKAHSRPEQHSNLVYDLLSDNDELILYKRHSSKHHKKGWVNKIELPPPIYEKHNLFFQDAITYDRFRNPEKHALREQSRHLEKKTKITQKYIDKQWLDKLENNRRPELNQHTHRLDSSNLESIRADNQRDSDDEYIPTKEKGYFARMSSVIFKDPVMSVYLTDDDADDDSCNSPPDNQGEV